MDRLKYVITTFILLLAAFVGYLSIDNHRIDIVLKSSDYSYLPKEAKNYIKTMYERTGQVILTERNKEENTPYLNPKYVQYLTLSDEEKNNVEVIPNTYEIDYPSSFKPKMVGATPPSSYDLRNVSGKNFITPLKNQGTLDLCWSFTSTEIAESYLLKTTNTSYSSSSKIFSTRQLDYGTSTDGLTGYNSDFGTRELTTGGNFFIASTLLTAGQSGVAESVMPWDTSTTTKDLATVLNYNNSLYEVDSTVTFPDVSQVASGQFTNYINLIKQYVMNYGGAYVATESPQKNCSSKMSNNTYLIRVDDKCTGGYGHAMQIIGWDDNYSYSYCKGTSHGSTSGCSSSNLVSGTGAWLLRNSWGNSYSYVYLAYDSDGSEIDFITSMTPMSSRTWNNFYHTPVSYDLLFYKMADTVEYEKKLDGKEKIQKIKFYSLGTNGTFNISIDTGSNTYDNVKTVSVALPGWVTVDLSDKNIVLDRSSFSITVNSTNSVSLLSSQIPVYTSNVDNIVDIKTDDIRPKVSGSYYDFYAYSKTKGIAANSTVSYKLLNSSGTDVSSKLTVVSGNKVARNDINAHLRIANSVAQDIYTLRITSGSKSFDSRIFIGNSFDLNGSGTENDPFLITSEDDLKLMTYSPNSTFKLTKNISISDAWQPIGTTANPFTGTFDGDNHTISGLWVTSNSNSAGLFGVASGNVKIKNLYMDNTDIAVTTDAGSLIGTYKGSNTSTVTINNIYIRNGTIYSDTNNAGSIIGLIDETNNTNGNSIFNINNVFSSATVGGKASSGMIGKIIGYSTNDSHIPHVNMTNVQNIGDINFSDVTPTSKSYGAFVGVLNKYIDFKLSKYITNTYFNGYSYTNTVSSKGLVGTTSYTTNITASNGYSIYENNNLATDSLYTWTDFSTYWKKETIDGVKRMPVLKNVSLNYSSFYPIILNKGETLNLSSVLDYDKYNELKLYAYDLANDVVTISNNSDNGTNYSRDVVVTAKKYGYTSFKVKNYYDGFITTVNIYIEPDNPVNIIYHSNNGNNDTIEDVIEKGDNVTVRSNSFSYTGRKFTGWNTKANGSGTSYAAGATINNVTTATDFYAQWTPLKYTIKFNANGGSGTMSDVVYYYNNSVSLPTNKFTKTDYEFIGWNTKANGSGTSYSDGASMGALSTTSDTTLTLYAQWRVPPEYTINNYSVDEQNHLIDLITPWTTLEQYLENFDIRSNYTVEVNLDDKPYIYTGSTTTIKQNGTVVATYTNVVRGDINGDSDISALDYVKVKNHIMGTHVMEALIDLLAADANMNEVVDALDYVRIKTIIMNGGN